MPFYMGDKFLLGLDLGQSGDYTALVIIEFKPSAAPAAGDSYHVRHIQRWPLGTSYVKIVEDLAGMVSRPPLADQYRIVVDRTGVGRGIYDMLAAADLRLTGITITGGDAVTDDGMGGYHVPKRDLVAAVQKTLGENRLAYAKRLPMASELQGELLRFEVKISPAGHDSYNAREGTHDDLTLALACALWFGERFGRVQIFFGSAPDATPATATRPLDVVTVVKAETRAQARADYLARVLSDTSW